MLLPMCFSAGGSFGVAAVLAGLGTVSLARDRPPSHGMLAAIPLLFALQQATEGVVWVTVGHASDSALHGLAVAAFLGFAVVLWPVWLPLAFTLPETNPRRRRLLSVLTAIGAVVAVGAAVMLLRGRPAAHVADHHIAYSYAQADSAIVLALYLPIYVIPSVLPFFVSTIRWAKAMGAVLVLALVATFVIERRALTSVWCFFAAILSGFIVLAMAGPRQRRR
jgi:hypothetical protein